MKTLSDIRSEFISYFKKQNHTHVDSSPLVPYNDPTLMFTNSGMVQFKDIFTGQKKTDMKRAVTSQKCVRAGGKHNDLDNVGFTGRHHTFFEMLGNFSFGDYFKNDAIAYGWEFVTKNLGLDKNRLYVTIYHEDEEAFNIWKKVSNFSDDRIIRIKTDDNFWSMGNTGPCGPCTEIFYDHGENVFGGLPGTKDEDGDRYVEIWNLVFMQYEKMADGSRTNLPNQSIDTGMGLERVAAVVQGMQDNYQTDLFRSLINASEELTSTKAEGDKKFSHRVIADHLRSTSFLIADGVMPSNDGRGYVLRRIIRRAVRHIHKLGYNDLLLPRLLPALANQMSEAYPQLIKAESLIKEVLGQEEANFRNTLERGLRLLDAELDQLGSGKILSGEVAFKLHDTYGFPLDLTQTILNEKNIAVDQEAFEASMDKQKELAKKSWSGSGEKSISKIWMDLLEEKGKTEFIGYNNISGQGKVVALLQEENFVDYVDNHNEFYLVTNQTPFYGESGGQKGDIGTISLENTEIQVLDCLKPLPKLIIHKCKLKRGLVKVDDVVKLEVDSNHRNNLKANHTATHLLHQALRSKLGEHVVQKGSLVAADRLRFDFSHSSAIPPNILNDLEKEINQLIAENLPVKSKVQSYDEAIDAGAMALFGEKYDSEVRVIYIGEEEEDKYSIELCGGTHVTSLGEICSFQIISESAIAAGIRRIEAVTRDESFVRTQSRNDLVSQMTAFLKCPDNEIFEKVESLSNSKKSLEKELQNLKASMAGKDVFSDKNCYKHQDVDYIISFTEGLAAKDLKNIISSHVNKDENKLVCILNVGNEGTISYVASATLSAAKKVSAGEVIKLVAKFFDLKGGGSPEFAQGGGKVEKPFEKQEVIKLISDYILSR